LWTATWTADVAEATDDVPDRTDVAAWFERTEDQTAFTCQKSIQGRSYSDKIIDVEGWSLAVNDWEPDISVE
jgi:hypothetical protein